MTIPRELEVRILRYFRAEILRINSIRIPQKNSYCVTMLSFRRPPMPTFDIPEHWSAEQALAVHDFLQELLQHIWDQYDQPLIELIQPQLDRLDDSQLDLFDPDDDIPF